MHQFHLKVGLIQSAAWCQQIIVCTPPWCELDSSQKIRSFGIFPLLKLQFCRTVRLVNKKKYSENFITVNGIYWYLIYISWEFLMIHDNFSSNWTRKWKGKLYSRTNISHLLNNCAINWPCKTKNYHHKAQGRRRWVLVFHVVHHCVCFVALNGCSIHLSFCLGPFEWCPRIQTSNIDCKHQWDFSIYSRTHFS